MARDKTQPTRKQVLGEWSHRANKSAVKEMQDGKYWFIARSEPQKETVAHHILTNKGIPAFLPLRTRYRRRNKYTRSKDKLIIPQFPCYIFVESETLLANWHEMTERRVVRGIAGCNGRAIKISSSRLYSFIMSKVMNLHTPGEHRFMHTHYEFGVGDMVEISEGSLAGFTFDVKEISNRKATALVELFGEMQEMRIPLENLIRVA